MMEWTSDKPTNPGWYYVRHPDSRNDPWIVEILDGDPIADGREWSSEPITEPQETA